MIGYSQDEMIIAQFQQFYSFIIPKTDNELHPL